MFAELKELFFWFHIVNGVGDMSLGRQEAFDIFMRDYSDRDKIEANKQFLKKRYTEAKALGEQLNNSKQKMSKIVTL